MSNLSIHKVIEVTEEHHKSFFEIRDKAIKPITEAYLDWNESVAFLVEGFYQHTKSKEKWHLSVANTLRKMQEPLRSDFILSSNTPKLQSNLIKGGVRGFCATILEENLEFMPKELEYPKFPYFEVEPATLQSLAKKGLLLFANPPAVDEDESDQPGTLINTKKYSHRPMVSVELNLKSLPPGAEGAVLLNWSCKGRKGAKAKVFIDGLQYVKSFEVLTTTDDSIPNFWTFIPWSIGKTIIDLKHVGSGYLWFEHVDIHHVEW